MMKIGEEMVGLRPQWAVKVIVVIIITSLLFRCVSAATNHSVGGASGWDLTSNIEGWAAETSFFVGDALGIYHLHYTFACILLMRFSSFLLIKVTVLRVIDLLAF